MQHSPRKLYCGLFCSSPVQSHAVGSVEKVLGHIAACDVHQNISRDHFCERRSSANAAGTREACSLHGAGAAHRLANRQWQWRRRRHHLCKINTHTTYYKQSDHPYRQFKYWWRLSLYKKKSLHNYPKCTQSSEIRCYMLISSYPHLTSCSVAKWSHSFAYMISNTVWHTVSWTKPNNRTNLIWLITHILQKENI